MKRICTGLTMLALAAALVLSGSALFGGPPARAQAPGPTSGTLLVGNLTNPRGMKVGPDGMIYVAEAGTAGDIAVGTGDNASKSGFTGRISKIDPATGARTTVADKLPSNGFAEGTVGPADVAFLNGQLYYIQTHGGVAYGFPNNPTGVYKVNSNGTVTLVGDIGAFNIANPVASIRNGTQRDIEPGGNPYAMTVRDGAFYVVDGNQNQIEKVTTAGTVTRFAEFDGHPVTTGITYKTGGPFFVGTFGQFPFLPSAGTVRQVGYPTGSSTQVAGGVSSITDVEFGPGGQLYALNFADNATNASAPPPWIPFTGKLMKVNANGTFTPLITGFTAASSVIFDGDTAYIVNNSVSFLGPGEIWKVTGVSSLQPLAVSPTPAPVPSTTPSAPAPTPRAPSGVVAPNTGSGPAGGDGFQSWYLAGIVIGIAGAVLVVSGRMAARR
ncbi:MAG: ScyD/ScyE family protein [Dehalococcoidia bacterium]|nr:ScyD/ScyE family protein [Dehalococcoidia bacterium]